LWPLLFNDWVFFLADVTSAREIVDGYLEVKARSSASV
jgi:hypothetical protein